MCAYKRQSPQPVTEGGTGIKTATTYAPLCGGTTGTGAFQSASSGQSTAGFVLTSNGSASLPTWQAASAPPSSSGALVFIQTQTVSSVSEIDFTAGITSKFNDYLVIFDLVWAAPNTSTLLGIQFSTDGGSTYITTGYDAQGTSLTSARFAITGSTTGSQFSSGSVNVSNLTSGANFPSVSCLFSTVSPTPENLGYSDGGSYVAGSIAANAFRIVATDGTNLYNMTGTASLYAYSTSATSGGTLTATVTLTNSQIKNLNTTSVQIVPAPAAGSFIFVTECIYSLNYGGTNAFTGGGSGINLYYGTTTTGTTGPGGSAFSMGATAITATSNQIQIPQPNQFSIAESGIDNQSVVAFAPAAITGNAANDNTITVYVEYQIISYPLPT